MSRDNIAIARARQNELDPTGSWRNTAGAPVKDSVVAKWQAGNPGGNKKQCARETGLSIHTVRKYWNDCGFELKGFSVEENARRTKAGEFKDIIGGANTVKRKKKTSQ